MIPNEEGWHCLAVKKISALLRGITSSHHGDFYWLNCLHSFAIQNKRDSQEKAWEIKDFCNNAMPSEDTATLEFNQYWKYDKTSFVNMLLLLNECLTEKFDGW